MKEFLTEISTADIQREKNRARELRRSEWWKRKRAAGVCFYCQRRFPPAERKQKPRQVSGDVQKDHHRQVHHQ